METKTKQTKKAKQAKNLGTSKKTLGRVQKDNQGEVWECVLYLRGNWIDLEQLAHRSYVGKGFSWSLSKIRPKTSKTTMLQVQYKFRGCWGDVREKYGDLGGEGLCQCDILRQENYRKGIRLVRAIIRAI